MKNGRIQQPKSQVNRRDEFNSILKSLAEYYGSNERKLIYFLYNEGYTVQKIANVLEVTKQALNVKYPKGGDKS